MNSQVESPFFILLTEDQLKEFVAHTELYTAKDRAQGMALAMKKKVLVFEVRAAYNTYTELIATDYTDIPF